MAVLQADPAPPDEVIRRRPRERWTPYALLAPTLVLVAIFLLYPIGSVVYYSLFKYNVTKPRSNGFIGLENYQNMLSDQMFWDSLRFTTQWVVVEVGLQLILGLGLALVINETFVGRSLARSLVFSPWAVAGVLTTTIWLLIYSPTTGFSRYLADIGIGSYGESPLIDGTSAFWAAVLAELWRGVPFFAILLLADLQTISQDLYEAAEVDGAGAWTKFWRITLPLLAPTTFFILIINLVGATKNFASIFVMTNGGPPGPGGSTTTVVYWIYQNAFRFYELGYAAALAYILFILLFGLSFLQYRWYRKRVEL
jgi:multiple sugar transport system permease protein